MDKHGCTQLALELASVDIRALGTSMSANVPPQCMVRGCCGALERKEVASQVQLVCLAATHHRGWLVTPKTGGNPIWEFTTRGVATLKGKLVGSTATKASLEENKGKPDGACFEENNGKPDGAATASLEETKGKPDGAKIDDVTLTALLEPAAAKALSVEAAVEACPEEAGTPPGSKASSVEAADTGVTGGLSEASAAPASKSSSLEGGVACPVEVAEDARQKRRATGASPSTTETPSKKPKVESLSPESAGKTARGVFGQKNAKAIECQVCNHARDSKLRGWSCSYCLAACRQLYSHQRISAFLDDNASLSAIRDRSVAERSRVVEPEDKADARQVGQLLKQLERLVKHLPRLEALAERLERLEGAQDVD